MKNIDDLLFPNNGKLVINEKEDCAEACIVDAEIDPIQCTFINDECITIKTEDLTYVMLTVDNLETMLRLICETTEYYEKKYNNTKNN
tara:strand:- start:3662 stop:3925 length:264 start_codon:yes stop_codon:yes gene_type:complete